MKVIRFFLLFFIIGFSQIVSKNKGLEWGDNSCYFDSSIQLMSHIDKFNNDLKNYEPNNIPPTSTYLKLIDLIKDKWTDKDEYLKSDQLLEWVFVMLKDWDKGGQYDKQSYWKSDQLMKSLSLREFHLKFSKLIDLKSGPKGQKDANEFVRFLMNAIKESIERLEEVLLDKYKREAINIGLDEVSASETARAQILAKNLLNPFKRLWLWADEKVVCSFCNFMLNGHLGPDFITDLPISDSGTLLECLHKYFGEEKLNDYKCEKCGKIGGVSKSLKISNLPDYLILSFKRNSYDKNSNRSYKLTNVVRFDNELDLNKNLGLLTNDLQNKLKGVSVKYKLKAFIVHGGKTLNSGHYWAYGRDYKDEWYLYNDAQILFAGEDKKITSYLTKSYDLVKKVIGSGLDNNVAGYSDATPYVLLYEKEEGLLKQESVANPISKSEALADKLKELQTSVAKTKKSIDDIQKNLETCKRQLA